VITHRLPLEQAAEAYKTFHEKKDRCIKVVLKPHGMPPDNDKLRTPCLREVNGVRYSGEDK